MCYTSSTPKARKNHKCFECRGNIDKGEQYRVFSGIWSDGPERYKFCKDCWDLRNELISVEDFAFGELCEAAEQDDKSFRKFAANHIKRNKTPWPWIVDYMNEQHEEN